MIKLRRESTAIILVGEHGGKRNPNDIAVTLIDHSIPQMSPERLLLAGDAHDHRDCHCAENEKAWAA